MPYLVSFNLSAAAPILLYAIRTDIHYMLEAKLALHPKSIVSFQKEWIEKLKRQGWFSLPIGSILAENLIK